MNTRHLVDPELLPGLDLFPKLDLEQADLPALRARLAAMLPPIEEYSREDVLIEHISVTSSGEAPDIPAIIYRPREGSANLPCLLNIHGGGYLFGSAAGMGPYDVQTASEVGCIVVSPDYRLAPETPAPGALEDCYAVLTWLQQNSKDLGLDPRRITIGGISAGGGIAAALAILAHDRGGIPPCFQMLIYPMLDDRTVTRPPEHDNPHTGEFIWTRQSNRIGWSAYLGTEPGGADISPYAAPARVVDLTGLPPAYITVGSLDLFLEENITYAQRLLQAGVTAELHILPGAYHGFELAAAAAITKRSEGERRAVLRRVFGG